MTVVERFGSISQRGVIGTPVMAGSLYVFGKLPTYPSPKPTLTLTSRLGQNAGLGGGVGAVSPKGIMILMAYTVMLYPKGLHFSGLGYLKKGRDFIS